MEEKYTKRNHNRRMRAESPRGAMYCPGCDAFRALSDFGKKSNSKYGVMEKCRNCLKKERSTDKQKQRRFFYHKKKNYGVTQKEYIFLYEKQKGKCALCGDPGEAIHKGVKIGLYLDHCHTTGKVRGLLCRSCNTGIGNLKDNIELLKAAIVYLEAHQ